MIHPGLRGKGLGKLLMLQVGFLNPASFPMVFLFLMQVEDWCKNVLGARVAHLTTHDQQVFYSRWTRAFVSSAPDPPAPAPAPANAPAPAQGVAMPSVNP